MMLGNGIVGGTFNIGTKDDWYCVNKDDYNKLVQENARLKKKLGWKKIKSVEQLEKLEPGTYGFLDTGGDNYYGVKGTKHGYFHLYSINDNGEMLNRVFIPKEAVEEFTQYRKMHSWHPVSKKKSSEEILTEISNKFETCGVSTELQHCVREPFHTDMTVRGKLANIATALGIDLEKKWR